MIPKPRVDPDDIPHGYCEECGEECTGELINVGIGPYEYWGSKESQDIWVWASPCCDADISDLPPDYNEDEDYGD